ncbi:dTDP-4-dehydrorhamnose 3,5-epimerase [Robbsia sp. Bb-Pol-6]|uniref:dTDP-4-dehydrorhamnose 3,5-epimerase n=1 Tax=Robbsia betulipollinis TaxID=2981849 RepID=A0ABT3ZM40_9BURK|nr:dTDP-4-dehydrorhamnose 3,5-epimerase [Robbsia betulipollinis]MCY0387571.1 dTDP-4-dehydrorhamnose 3,5-epimerase [Robbsia betulipollinis]
MPIILRDTAIPDVKIIEPVVFDDARGFFYESFNAREFSAALGRETVFVQDNHSRSARNVVRGLHYQISHPQGKLVRVIAGEVFDVAVDLRRRSPTCGKWVGARLSAENRRQLWVPEGFAHGFMVLSEFAECVYKTTDYWYPEHECCLVWDDLAVAVDWPTDVTPARLAPRDAAGVRFADAALYP